jgi:hypothetical protein
LVHWQLDFPEKPGNKPAALALSLNQAGVVLGYKSVVSENLVLG